MIHRKIKVKKIEIIPPQEAKQALNPLFQVEFNPLDLRTIQESCKKSAAGTSSDLIYLIGTTAQEIQTRQVSRIKLIPDHFKTITRMEFLSLTMHMMEQLKSNLNINQTLEAFGINRSMKETLLGLFIPAPLEQDIHVLLTLSDVPFVVTPGNRMIAESAIKTSKNPNGKFFSDVCRNYHQEIFSPQAISIWALGDNKKICRTQEIKFN